MKEHIFAHIVINLITALGAATINPEKAAERVKAILANKTGQLVLKTAYKKLNSHLAKTNQYNIKTCSLPDRK